MVFTDQGPERAKALSEDMFKKRDVAAGFVAPDLLAAVIASAAKQSIFVASRRTDCLAALATTEKRAGNHPFSDATPSISISILGSGNACTTQVVRAG